jgi:hypothetical protein
MSMGDRAFLRFNARLEPDQLKDGELSVSENGRMDRGVWQPRPAIESLSGTLQVTGDPLRLPFFVVNAVGGETVLSAARLGTSVSVSITPLIFEVGAAAYVGIEGLTGTVDPNGVWLATALDAQTLGFQIPGATGNETYGGTGKVRSVIDDDSAAQILGSCLFSDPSDESAEYIVEAATGTAYLFSVADGTSTAIDYPGTATITSADLIQAFDRVYLFRDGLQSWEWFGTQGRAVSASILASNIVTVTLKGHGLTAGDSVVLSGIGFVTTNPNGTRVVASILTANTFTFALTGANETFTANTGRAVTGFTKVPSGAYTQPQVFEVDTADADVSSGLATFTVTGNSTIFAGDSITIYDATDEHFVSFIGRSFTVTAASATAISFYIPVADHDASGHSDYVTIGKLVSVGAGFQHMPAPPFGVYHQRRLIAPYRYSQTGTTASPVFTDRNVRDELVISDILDPNTHDAIANQFRITAGIADFIVAFQPFYEDGLIVFNRNSLHLIGGLSGSLSDCTVNELTREIGCLARKSIAQHGAEILFLSDDGVYSVTFLDRYNLRGVDLPLSDPIQPIIDRINPDLASEAVGVYFANRYYLAVPLDSVRGAGDATGNNSVLIYNFLNQGWESVDSVADARWNVLNFHIARSGARNDLYAVNTLGGVHKLDATDSDFDELSLSPGESMELVGVVSELQTRQYDGETLDRKRFTELQVQLGNSGLNSEADFTFTVEDIDESVTVGSIQTLLGEVLPPNEDASVRGRIGGLRGQGGIVTVTPQTGRPRIKSVLVTATGAFGSTTSVS